MLRTLAFALLALAPSGALSGDTAAAATPTEATPPRVTAAGTAPGETPANRRAPAPSRVGAPGERAGDTAAATALAGGRIEAQGARVEILSRPLRAGDTIELPEGYLRVEEDAAEDGEVGSFSIVPARTLQTEWVALAESGGGSGAPPDTVTGAEAGAAPSAAPARRCRRERAAYLRELWKESGIEVADPDAVIEGLEADGGPASGFYWFALATDPFRPLAWSSSLRSRADALARCVRPR